MATKEINDLYREMERSLRRISDLDGALDKAKSSSDKIAVLETQLKNLESIELNAAVRARVITAYTKSILGNMQNESKTFNDQIKDFIKKMKSIPRDHPQAESAKDKIAEAKAHLKEMKRAEVGATRLLRSARKTASGRGLIGRGFLR